MLDSVAKLPRHLVGNVDRVLGDEIDADALRSDQPHDLLDLVEQRAGRIVEQQVRLVEEEGEHGLVGIADFGELFEQFAQQPQQEGGVELGARHQFVGGEDVDDAAARIVLRSEEHTSELQSLMRISYAVFCLKTKKPT